MEPRWAEYAQTNLKPKNKSNHRKHNQFNKTVELEQSTASRKSPTTASPAQTAHRHASHPQNPKRTTPKPTPPTPTWKPTPVLRGGRAPTCACCDERHRPVTSRGGFPPPRWGPRGGRALPLSHSSSASEGSPVCMCVCVYLFWRIFHNGEMNGGRETSVSRLRSWNYIFVLFCLLRWIQKCKKINDELIQPPWHNVDLFFYYQFLF